MIQNEEVKLTINDIRMVLKQSKRDDFMNRWRQIHTKNNGALNDIEMNRLTYEVFQELENQNEIIKEIQSKVDTSPNNQERKDIIMSIESDSLRTRLIQDNADLFNNQASQVKKENDKLFYDEASGLYLTEAQRKQQQRNQIMAIADPKEREMTIANNLHLFR